jgi:hypothetical protein
MNLIKTKERNINQSYDKENTETSKSAKSAKSNNIREISPSTMISSMEREVSEVLQETTLRSTRNKLMSIQETLKLFSRRFKQDTNSNRTRNSTDINLKRHTISEFQHNSFNFEDILRSKEEAERLNLKYESDLKKLRDELKFMATDSNFANTAENKEMIKDETLSKLNLKLEQLNFSLNEEKDRNSQLVTHIKSLEDTIKSLDGELEIISYKFKLISNESESYGKNLSEYRKCNNDLKLKFEELVKINSDLKSRIVDNDNSLKLQTEEVKSMIKKNSTQSKLIEELEASNKLVKTEMNYKEQRMKALRKMNSNLEQKSLVILKKFESIKFLEEKSSEAYNTNQKMLDLIEDLNSRLKKESLECDHLRKFIQDVTVERNRIKIENDNLKTELSKVRSQIEELGYKNHELETKIKLSVDSKDMRESKVKNRKASSNTTQNNLNNTATSFVRNNP